MQILVGRGQVGSGTRPGQCSSHGETWPGFTPRPLGWLGSTFLRPECQIWPCGQES